MVQFKSLLDTMRGLLFFQLKKATISLYMEVVALFLDYKYFVLMKILRGHFQLITRILHQCPRTQIYF